MGENYWLKAIHHSDQGEQLLAFYQFLVEESRRTEDRIDDLLDDDGTIPEENADTWNYEKGRLDALRTMIGLVTQACLNCDEVEEFQLGDLGDRDE